MNFLTSDKCFSLLKDKVVVVTEYLCSSGQLLGVHSFADINLQMLLAKGSNLVTAFHKTKCSPMKVTSDAPNHSFADINLQMLLAKGSNLVTAFHKTKCSPMKVTSDAPGSRIWSWVEGVPVF